MNDIEIREVRAFNRLYTQIVGLVNEHILDSAYSLPEARVLFELDRRPGLTASELIGMLDMDKGYLSRMLRRFEEKKLISRVAAADRRAARLSLTARGRKEFASLDSASNAQVGSAFAGLSMAASGNLIGHMRAIAAIIHQSKMLL